MFARPVRIKLFESMFAKSVAKPVRKKLFENLFAKGVAKPVRKKLFENLFAKGVCKACLQRVYEGLPRRAIRVGLTGLTNSGREHVTPALGTENASRHSSESLRFNIDFLYWTV